MAIRSWNYHGILQYLVDAESDLASITNPKQGQVALAIAEGSLHFHTGSEWQAISGGSGSGAPTDVDYLVGTADSGLSAEIAVGTTPGGELGGTWASPTVDETHAGTTHSAATDTHIADTTDVHDHGSLAGLTDDDHTQYLKEADFDDVDFLVGTATGHTGAEIVAGTAPGGELGGTWASPTVDATHSGSTHSAAADTHIADTTDAHDASAVSFDPTGLSVVTGTEVQTAIEELDAAAGGTGAPTDVDYLVGTASGDLSAEIAVGTTPGGELGGTWASPTVDATHSGSTHSAATDTHIADAADAHDASAISVDSTTLVGTGTDVQAVFEEVDNDIVALKAPDYLVGTATGTLAGEIVAGTAPGGELGGTWGSPTVDATHSGSTHSAATDTHIADTTDVHDHGSLAGLTDDDTQYRKESDVWEFVTFSKTGNLSTGTGTMRKYNDTGRTLTVVEIRSSVGTAPATTDIIVDVNENGTTLMSGTKVVIAAAANTGTQGTFSDASLADGNYLTSDIDQVGTGTVGADLTTTVWVTG